MYTKWLAITVVVLGFGIHHISPAHGQTHGEQDHKKIEADRESKKVALFLNTTPEQDREIQVVRGRYLQELNAVKSNKGLASETAKQQTLALRQRAEASLEQILSADQVVKLKIHGGFGILLGYSKAVNPLDLLAKLDLTPEQSAQLKKIVSDSHRELDALSQDRSLSADQVKLRMEQVHTSAMAQVHGLLTPAQMQRLHKLMEQHHKSGGGHSIPPTH